MFWLRNKNNNFQLCTLIWGPVIGMDHVISELCYKGIILQRNYTKMTIYNPIICKIPWYFFLSHMSVLYPNLCYNECVIKRLHCIEYETTQTLKKHQGWKVLLGKDWFNSGFVILYSIKLFCNSNGLIFHDRHKFT